MNFQRFSKSINDRFHAKAAAFRLQLETRLDRIMQIWLLSAGLACAVRVGFSPRHSPPGLETVLPYFFLILAPFASIVLALRWFTDGDSQSQPTFRLARVGRWRTLSQSQASAHPLYGAGGIMVSLLVGTLLNIPVRALEYLGSMPAISGPIPAWLSVLHTMMTLDVVLMSSLYAIAFVAALRHVPLFPRLLVAVWGLDLAFQLVTAEIVARTAGLPAPVGDALQSLLEGNVKKALISAGLWLPYLLLSRRVNVTYRRRVAA